MTPTVKSTYRQEQAEATKDRIARAARRLFALHGYGSTSMTQVASEAGVASRTVYSAFGSKREILSRICELWLEEAGARERAQAVMEEPDEARRLTGTAAWLTHLYATGLDVATVFDGATGDGPETRALLRAKLAGRDEVLDMMVASLEGLLSMPVARAQAVLRGLAAPGVYRALVVDAGWSPDEFTAWVAGALVRTDR